eukprot:11000048-Alexandrium_andersonii.AAC.1
MGSRPFRPRAQTNMARRLEQLQARTTLVANIGSGASAQLGRCCGLSLGKGAELSCPRHGVHAVPGLPRE